MAQIWDPEKKIQAGQKVTPFPSTGPRKRAQKRPFWPFLALSRVPPHDPQKSPKIDFFQHFYKFYKNEHHPLPMQTLTITLTASITHSNFTQTLTKTHKSAIFPHSL